MPGILPKPTGYQTLALQADYLTGPRQFAVTKFDVTAPGFALDASGTLTLNDNGAPGPCGQGACSRHAGAPASAFIGRSSVASGARDWIDANIFAGDMGPLDAEVNFAPGMMDQEILPEDSLKLTFGMKNVEGNYVKGLTHATQVTGDAILTGDTFRANFTSGKIGPLTVSRGTALIPNLHLKGTVGQFGVHVDGAMPDIMTLIDMKPLGYPTRFGIDPRQTGGAASADLAFQVPMLANLPVDAVGISVKAQVNAFAVTLGGKMRLTDGAVNFEIDNNHLHQVGVVNLADTRLNVDWTEDFKTPDPVTTRLAVKGNMTEAARAALNINLQRFFRGTVPITADMTGHRGSLLHADVTVDFTPATPFGADRQSGKDAGAGCDGAYRRQFRAWQCRAGRNHPDLRARSEPERHRQLSAAMANLTVLNLPIGADGGAERPVVPAFARAQWRRLSVAWPFAGRLQDRPHRLQRAAGRRAGRCPAGRGHAGRPPAYRRQARPSGDARRRGDRAFQPGSGARRQPAIRARCSAAMSLLGSKSAPIAANLETSAAGRKVTLTSGDAGLLARGVFAFESMRGGQLSATINLPGQAGDPVNPNSRRPISPA